MSVGNGVSVRGGRVQRRFDRGAARLQALSRPSVAGTRIGSPTTPTSVLNGKFIVEVLIVEFHTAVDQRHRINRPSGITRQPNDAGAGDARDFRDVGGERDAVTFAERVHHFAIGADPPLAESPLPWSPDPRMVSIPSHSAIAFISPSRWREISVLPRRCGRLMKGAMKCCPCQSRE